MLFREQFFQNRPIYYYRDICVTEELEKLGIEADIVESVAIPRDCFTKWSMLFHTKEDMNLYKISGLVKEAHGVSFMLLDDYINDLRKL